MLKKNNDADLINIGVDKLYIPFVQLWKELLDNRTLDVHQYRLLNSLVALKELKEVLKKTINNTYTNDGNLDCCKEETLNILKKDMILNKYKKPLLNILENQIGKSTKKPSEKLALLYRIQYGIKDIQKNYLNYLITELKNSIDCVDIKNIELYSNPLIAECINRGWSAKALFELHRYFINNEKNEAWRKFVNELKRIEKTEFDVLISLKSGSKGVDDVRTVLGEMGCNIKTYKDLVEMFAELDDIRTILKSDTSYIYLQVMSYDIYSAAHIGIKNVSNYLNMASFYNFIDAWDLRTTTILPINKITKYHKPIPAEDLYKTHDYLDSSSKIFESTVRVFSDTNKKYVQDKLKGSFIYTNISRASLFQEEKYINAWVALESLARTDMYDNIISSVKEILPAALCLRYSYRIIRNFAEDCLRCNVNFNFSTVYVNLNQDSKQNLVKEIISVMRNDSLSNELLEKCKVNSLLLYRYSCLKSLVTDLSYARSKIENHYRNVKWQIQRLYRVRNEIAHSALQDDASLVILIEHLYDYLSVFISEIVTCMEDKALGTLEETYCKFMDNYESFLELTSNQADCTINSFMETGIIDLVN